MINFFEALEYMHGGGVVQYMGTVNGNCFIETGESFCMCRGVVFKYDRIKKCVDGFSMGAVYDPGFRYKKLDIKIDTRIWPDVNFK